MKDAEKTVGNILDKQNTLYLSSIDENGFPHTRAMLPARRREGSSAFIYPQIPRRKR
jgi:general stress protein 26